MFLFAQWLEYFHSVKDGMFYSTRPVAKLAVMLVMLGMSKILSKKNFFRFFQNINYSLLKSDLKHF